MQRLVGEALKKLKKDQVRYADDLVGNRQEALTHKDCVRVRDVCAKNATTTEKNFIGQYKDPHLYEWDRILRQYDTAPHLRVAENARSLISICIYEIPSLRRKTEDARKKLEHLDRARSSLEKSISLAAKELQKSCDAVEIDASEIGRMSTEAQISKRLFRSVNFDNLRVALQQVREAMRTKTFVDACDFYDDFCSYLATFGEKSTLNAKHLPRLRTIQQSDEPQSLSTILGRDVVEEEKVAEDVEITNVAGSVEDGGFEGSIDWGIDIEDETNKDQDEIDWGDGGDENETDTIDWGIEAADEEETEAMGIELVQQDITSDEELSMTKTGEPESVISLADSDTQEGTLDDIEELISFLEQRCQELDDSDGNVKIFSASDKTQKVADSVRFQSLDNVRSMLQCVEDAKAELTSRKLRETILIASSSTFRNRIAKEMMNLRRRSVKLKGKKIELNHRRSTILSTISDVEPRCIKAEKKARALRGELAGQISSLINGREVRIIGTRL